MRDPVPSGYGPPPSVSEESVTERPALFLHHDHMPWALDATTMGSVTPAALDKLGWTRAFSDMLTLERGEIANPDDGRRVGHFWLRAPDKAPDLGIATGIGAAAAAARALAAAVRSGEATTDAGERFTDVLHIGIGGSQLGPALLVDALAHDAFGAARGLPVHFLDNTDPDGISAVLGRLGSRLRTTLVVVVTKSGGTAEPRNALALTWLAMTAQGVSPARHLVGITVKDSALWKRAESEGWRASLEIWPWVGGRYSVMSAVGILPAELAGIDSQALIDGAAAMDDWTRAQSWRENPAALLAGCWYLEGQGTGERAMVALPYADRLVTLSRYLQQLVMESLGKELDRQGNVVHQGLTVYGNKGSSDQHAYVQQLRDGRNDFFVLFLQVLNTAAPDPDLEDGVGAGDYLQGFLLGTRRALAEGGRSSLTLTIPEVSERTLGGLIALFERAVGLYGSLIDINAYHQPGVEAGKRAAAEVLNLSRRIRAELSKSPGTLAELAARTDADTLETFYVLQRLVHTERVTLTGGGLDGRYQLP